MRKPLDYTRYKVRRCMYGDECAICKGRITVGDSYYDGGYGRRAHIHCSRERPDLQAKQKAQP